MKTVDDVRDFVEKQIKTAKELLGMSIKLENIAREQIEISYQFLQDFDQTMIKGNMSFTDELKQALKPFDKPLPKL